MFNSLLRLLDDSNLDYLENRLSAGIERFRKSFSPFFTSFEDKGDYYELSFDVADDAKASNVTVDYDDDTRELSIEYKYENKNFTNKSIVKETLPADADDSTIEAKVEDGKLKVGVAKLFETDEPEDEIDDITVKINRKK